MLLQPKQGEALDSHLAGQGREDWLQHPTAELVCYISQVCAPSQAWQSVE